MSDVLEELTQAGVSVWLDDISRNRLVTGNLAALIKDSHVRGVTSNPTIFANALAKGEAYDEQIEALLEGSTDPYRAAEGLLAES